MFSEIFRLMYFPDADHIVDDGVEVDKFQYCRVTVLEVDLEAVFIFGFTQFERKTDVVFHIDDPCPVVIDGNFAIDIVEKFPVAIIMAANEMFEGSSMIM